jgi:hypothetical protein
MKESNRIGIRDAEVERNIQLHNKFFAHRRDWCADLAGFFQCSPITIGKWAIGQAFPNDKQLAELSAINSVWERKKPFSRFAAQDAERLNSIRSTGIRFVQVQGCNNPGDDCEECLALRNRNIKIDLAPTLPLVGCDLPFCKCIVLASE